MGTDSEQVRWFRDPAAPVRKSTGAPPKKKSQAEPRPKRSPSTSTAGKENIPPNNAQVNVPQRPASADRKSRPGTIPKMFSQAKSMATTEPDMDDLIMSIDLDRIPGPERKPSGPSGPMSLDTAAIDPHLAAARSRKHHQARRQGRTSTLKSRNVQLPRRAGQPRAELFLDTLDEGGGEGSLPPQRSRQEFMQTGNSATALKSSSSSSSPSSQTTKSEGSHQRQQRQTTKTQSQLQVCWLFPPCSWM